MFFLVHREKTRRTLLIHPTEPTMVQGELAEQPVCLNLPIPPPPKILN